MKRQDEEEEWKQQSEGLIEPSHLTILLSVFDLSHHRLASFVVKIVKFEEIY